MLLVLVRNCDDSPKTREEARIEEETGSQNHFFTHPAQC